jgi:predicted DNA-binding protein with PD1-like motif
MKASEGRVGRVFVIRLEHGDIIPDCVERFAEAKKISVGQVIMIGGIGEGQVVVGPRRSDEMLPEPMIIPIDGGHEVKAESKV